jgi:hypothetical protein
MLAGEPKQYLALNAYSEGELRLMDLVQSRRPVVLIVEDDFLLRVDAADMIGRRTVSAQALQSDAGCRRAARADSRLNSEAVIPGRE